MESGKDEGRGKLSAKRAEGRRNEVKKSVQMRNDEQMSRSVQTDLSVIVY